MEYIDWLNFVRPEFPALTERNSRPTSPADEGYNCIAWAAEDPTNWWWPDELMQNYWPPNIPRKKTLAAFELAFGLLGYSERTDGSLELGKQKIAIFADEQGIPTHAARQLADGWWASKLGQNIDIEHESMAVQGKQYGTVALVLGRTYRSPEL